MTPPDAGARALRRDALAARAALQRIELASTVAQLRQRSMATRGLGALALRAAAGLARGRSGPSPGPRARPWMASAAWLLWRGLRASPTMRWMAGAAALGGAVWWVARALRAPGDAPDDGSADAASDASDESAEAGG